MPQFEFEGERYTYESDGPGGGDGPGRNSDMDAVDGSAELETLLLLMPQSSGPAGTTTFVETLLRRNRVVQYQQPGVAGGGRSIDMHYLGRQADALLDHLGNTSVHLVCHSTGCGIGLSLAAAQSDRVASLVLITPWTHADAHLHALQTLRQTIARTLDNEQYERFNSALLFPPAYRRQHEEGFAQLARNAKSKTRDVDTFVSRLDAILAFDARQLWPAVQCPTLVIGADDDQLMPVWFSEETASGIDRAELMTVDNGGHMLPETRGRDVAERIQKFLSTVRAGST